MSNAINFLSSLFLFFFLIFPRFIMFQQQNAHFLYFLPKGGGNFVLLPQN